MAQACIIRTFVQKVRTTAKCRSQQPLLSTDSLATMYQLCIRSYRPPALCCADSLVQCPGHPLAPAWGHVYCCQGYSVVSHPVWTAGQRSGACQTAAAAPVPAYPDKMSICMRKRMFGAHLE